MTTFISLGSPVPVASWITSIDIVGSPYYLHVTKSPPADWQWLWKRKIDLAWRFASKEEAELWVLNVYYVRFPGQKGTDTAKYGHPLACWEFIEVTK